MVIPHLASPEQCLPFRGHCALLSFRFSIFYLLQIFHPQNTQRPLKDGRQAWEAVDSILFFILILFTHKPINQHQIFMVVMRGA